MHMIIDNIHDLWGSTIEFNNPLDFFQQPYDFWRELLYKRKLLIFKKMNFTKSDYGKFGYYFGKPWDAEQYVITKDKLITDNGYVMTNHTSKIKWLSHTNLDFHADLPNLLGKTIYPIRSLWMIKNPNSAISGHTGWLNITDGIKYLSKDLLELMPRVKLLQQRIHNPGTDFKMVDLVKTHIVTGEKSLGLNCYSIPNTGIHGWIREVYVDDIQQPDCLLIQQYIDELSKYPELYIKQIWDTNDIVIWDNYASIHNRGPIILGDDESNNERLAYGINISHLSELHLQNFR